MEKYLRPTAVIDCDNESVKHKANQLTEGQGSATDKAIPTVTMIATASATMSGPGGFGNCAPYPHSLKSYPFFIINYLRF